MGNKSAARRIATDAEVPVVLGLEESASDDDAVETAGEIGYPVMVKAAAGGGGRGIRVAETKRAPQGCARRQTGGREGLRGRFALPGEAPHRSAPRRGAGDGRPRG